VINQSYTNTPNAQAIFRDKNIGGEALYESLDKCRGRHTHISQNYIEYLEGWGQTIVNSFEVFLNLGQLSLFVPVTSDDETNGIALSLLRHSK
jgi:hypothetical protein